MDNSEGKSPFTSYIAFEDNETLVEVHPSLFNKMSVDSIPMYVESKKEDNDTSLDFQEDKTKFEEEDSRIFLMPSGPVVVSSPSLVDTKSLWNISEEDRDFLSELNKFVEELNREWINTKTLPKSELKRIGNITYKLEFLPYGHADSLIRLSNIVEKKLKKREVKKDI